tara:strand:+ start:243 stop:659 length:417 start_codon:yes stop_codon:yes gene_type:complete
MTLEHRLERLEKRNKRLTTALTLMAVAMCAVVTMAAKEAVQGEHKGRNMDLTHYKQIRMDWLKAEWIRSQGCVVMSNWNTGDGYAKVTSRVDKEGNGQIIIFNKTGEQVVTIGVDEYGNGVVGAYNRKGRGRTLKPGP